MLFCKRVTLNYIYQWFTIHVLNTLPCWTVGCLLQITSTCHVKISYLVLLCSYLTGEHGTKVVTAGGQDDTVGWKVCVLQPQSDVAECVALAKSIHCIEDGFGMGVCHDVLGSHDVLKTGLHRSRKTGVQRTTSNTQKQSGGKSHTGTCILLSVCMRVCGRLIRCSVYTSAIGF